MDSSLVLIPYSQKLSIHVPLSIAGNRLHHYSRILDPNDPTHTRPLPSCPQLKWAIPKPLNSSNLGKIFRPKNPLSASDFPERDAISPNRNLKSHGDMGALYPFEEYHEQSPRFLFFVIMGLGVAILWFFCRLQKRPRGRRSLFPIKV